MGFAASLLSKGRLVQSSCSTVTASKRILSCFHSQTARRKPLAGTLTGICAGRQFPHPQLHSRCYSLRVHSSATLERSGKNDVIIDHPGNNVTPDIASKMEAAAQMHRKDDHPLGIIKNEIYRFLDEKWPGKFNKFDDLNPVVTVKANFDDVLIPQDHVSRNPNDTYYVDSDRVLRCHTSAHQAELLRKGETAFLVTGDVYRRDSIDSSHYNIFHQMEGVRIFSPSEWEAAGLTAAQFLERDLKATLEGLAKHLFGDVEMRWIDAYFPFTEPSFELEIFYMGEWLEVLGCGVMQQSILDNAGNAGNKGWAFGLGLERLAMVLFEIPDIRLFWSSDERFLKQFKKGTLQTRFKPYSKYPPCFKDVSFWINNAQAFSENNLCEVIRGVGGDLVESVKLVDEFTHPKTNRTSQCFRIAYRSMERSLTDDEINDIQDEVRRIMPDKLLVELR